MKYTKHVFKCMISTTLVSLLGYRYQRVIQVGTIKVLRLVPKMCYTGTTSAILSPEELFNQIEGIAKECGFGSAYTLLRYMILNLLRNYGENKTEGEEEELRMFALLCFPVVEDSELIQQAIKNIESRDKWRKRQQKHRQMIYSMRDQKKDETIEDEINSMFSEYETEGYPMQFADDVNKRY